MLEFFIWFIRSHLAFHTDFYMRLLNVTSWNLVLSHLSFDLFEHCLINFRKSICFAFHLLDWSLLCSNIFWGRLAISNATIFTGAILNWLDDLWVFKRAYSSTWGFRTSIFEIALNITSYSWWHGVLLFLLGMWQIGRRVSILMGWKNLDSHWRRSTGSRVIRYKKWFSIF